MLFWVKKEEMTEGRKASRASKSKPGPPLNSRPGFTTKYLHPSNGEEELDADYYIGPPETPDYLEDILAKSKTII